jgi:hypothetical protein
MPIEGQAYELLKGDPVIDLVFQLQIGINPTPLLQEESFQKHQRRVSVGTFTAASDGIMSRQNLFHLRPVDDLIYFFESFETAVMFHGL